jgi:predicted fused transcriptional regulator/phosphomethylpyrimidine kinase
MAIELFAWTEHARERLLQRRLDAVEVERAISGRHADREVNDGRAEWLITGVTENGVRFEAIYDHPHDGDEAAVRIVSVWRLDS